MTNPHQPELPAPMTASMCPSSDYAKGWNDCLAASRPADGVVPFIWEDAQTDTKRVVSMLAEVAKAAHYAMDDCGDLLLTEEGAARLGNALDNLDELPELNDGYVRDGWCKAKDWLAAMLAAAPTASAPTSAQAGDSIYSPVSPEEEEAIDKAAGLAKVVLRLPIDLLGEIDHRAQQDGCVRNAYLRELLARHHSEPTPDAAALAIPMDKGPWRAGDDGRNVYSDDFTAGVSLRIDGDFMDDHHRKDYAAWLARTLNLTTPSDAGGGE